MDPPSLDPKPHKKRKHKHKNIEKGEEGGEGIGPSSKAEVPSDAYTFIKQDTSFSTPHISLAPTHAPSHTHGYMSSVIMGDGSVGGMAVQHQTAKAILAQSHSFQPTIAIPSECIVFPMMISSWDFVHPSINFDHDHIFFVSSTLGIVLML